jgi:hypothetical protein
VGYPERKKLGMRDGDETKTTNKNRFFILRPLNVCEELGWETGIGVSFNDGFYFFYHGGLSYFTYTRGCMPWQRSKFPQDFPWFFSATRLLYEFSLLFLFLMSFFLTILGE